MKLSIISEMPMRIGSDLPPGVYVAIERQAEKVLFYYSNPNRKRSAQPAGIMSIVNIGKGIWEVGQVKTDRGWGPLLYELAIEYATAHGNGLAPDRVTVSNRAAAVWGKFAERSDVDHSNVNDGYYGHGKRILDSLYTKKPTRTTELESAGLIIRL